MNGKYLCLHKIAYAIGCQNRDEHNRPKTVVVGNTIRNRISSQALKRAWRNALKKMFKAAIQTRHFGEVVAQRLIDRGVKEATAIEHAKRILNVFSESSKKKKKENGKKNGKENGKKKEGLAILQMKEVIRIFPEEEEVVNDIIERIAKGEKMSDDDYKILRVDTQAVDALLGGRMLASKSGYNMSSAMSVNHAFNVLKSEPDEDYFTATDDMGEDQDETGAAHLNRFGFGENLNYSFCCIDVELLLSNLGGDAEFKKRMLQEFVEVMMKVSPDGKAASYADSKGWAIYFLAEWCDEPRSLAVAFLDPVEGKKLDEQAIQRMEETRRKFMQCYGEENESYVVNVVDGQGSLKELQKFVAE